jgi:integrase/recombinase XerD
MHTLNQRLVALKSLFRKISAFYGIQNPFDTLKAAGVKTTFLEHKTIDKTRLLSRSDKDILLQHFSDRMKSSKRRTRYTAMRYHVLVQLLYGHGLRISEALRTMYEDIKQFKKQISINITGKSDRQREIYITMELHQSMLTLSDLSHPFGFVFKSLAGNQMDRSIVTRELKRISLKVLGKEIHSHIFRHSFATNLLEQKPDKLKAISNYLGHSSTATTQNMYIHDYLNYADLASI